MSNFDLPKFFTLVVSCRKMRHPSNEISFRPSFFDKNFMTETSHCGRWLPGLFIKYFTIDLRKFWMLNVELCLQTSTSTTAGVHFYQKHWNHWTNHESLFFKTLQHHDGNESSQPRTSCILIITSLLMKQQSTDLPICVRCQTIRAIWRQFFHFFLKRDKIFPIPCNTTLFSLLCIKLSTSFTFTKTSFHCMVADKTVKTNCVSLCLTLPLLARYGFKVQSAIFKLDAAICGYIV